MFPRVLQRRFFAILIALCAIGQLHASYSSLTQRHRSCVSEEGRLVEDVRETLSEGFLEFFALADIALEVSMLSTSEFADWSEVCLCHGSDRPAVPLQRGPPVC